MRIDRDWKSKAIVYFYFAEVDYSGFWLKFLKDNYSIDQG